MQFNITNGTLTQIQETLTASSGYTLPSSIIVAGTLNYNYNNSTGVITLTGLTSAMSIVASGEPIPTEINNVSIGTLKLAKALVGSDEISQMWLGNVKIYEKGGTPSGYNVSITFSNCADKVGDKYLVFDDITYSNEVANTTSSNQIGQLSTDNGTINVSTTTGKIYICCPCAVINIGTNTYSNGIIEDGTTSTNLYIDNNPTGYFYYFICSVNADGTITIDGYNWND